MKKLWIVFFNLFMLLFFAQGSFAEIKQVKTTVARVALPVKISANSTGWTTIISVCNTTANSIPLTDIELDFNYSSKMPDSIWGTPWVGWKVSSQQGTQVILLGGTPWTPPLASDPNCTHPLTTEFNSTPQTPLPTGPFVFKAEGATPPTDLGNLTITVPAAPEAGLNNPQITVQGAGQTFNQTVAWGTEWQISKLTAGTYKVTSSTVTNGTHTYSASPINVIVSANSTAQAKLVYTQVTPTTGNLTITLPAAPEAGLNNPQITVQGSGQTLNQTVVWGGNWKLTNLAVGSYTVTSSTVTNGTHTYQSDPVNVTVSANTTAQVALQYKLVTTGTGNLTITLPASPEAGVSNPQLTVQGMGQTLNQTVLWGTQWKLTNLAAGTYKITSSLVCNGTHNYQADPVNVTITAGNTSQANLQFKLVTGTTGNLTISLPAIPEAGLGNPQITVQGMGQTLNQTVAWGTQWPLTNLAVGSYTVSSSNVTNGTHTYQANSVNANVSANTTTPVSLTYTQVSSGRPSSWNNIKHVVIIVFENTGAGSALGQPFFKSMTTKGAYLSQSFAVAHPSEPNYLGLAGGSTFGVTDDGNHNINAKHIGDLFDAKGLTWKSYAEAYPGNCFQGSSSGTYYRKHEPFISFTSVQNNAAQCAKIVPAPQFFTDLNANNLPTYSLYVPDINNDGHDTGVAFADRWLSNTFGSILNNPAVMNNTLFILTFDEDDGGSSNHIYTSFVGAAVKAGASSATRYTHYSVLKTIEDIFQLGTLGASDQGATEINDIWLP